MTVQVQIETKNKSRNLILKPCLTFGRNKESADVFLDDPKVSSIHFQITYDGDEVLVKDLGSKNGTYINGQKIEEETALYTYDIIAVGSYKISLNQNSLNNLELAKFSRHDEPNPWGENVSNIHRTLKFALEEEKKRIQINKKLGQKKPKVKS